MKAGTDLKDAAAEGGQLTTLLAASSLLKDLPVYFHRGRRRASETREKEFKSLSKIQVNLPALPRPPSPPLF